MFLETTFEKVRNDIQLLNAATPMLLRDAKPPNTSGVYLLLHEGVIIYAGEAKGSKGLRDRLGKHVSGDASYALVRAFGGRYPDRK